MERQKERTYADSPLYNSNTLNVDHHNHYHICGVRCLSIVAITVGAIVAIALSFLVNLFSLSVGLTAFPITPEGKTQFAIWGFLGLVALGIVTMFASGWIAGLLGRANCYKRNLGELYGLTAWGLALIVSIFLAAQIGQFLGQRGVVIDRNNTVVGVTQQAAANVNQAVNTISNKNTSPATVNAAQNLGITTFAAFFILFIGALSATFGGRCGMRYNRKLRPDNCPTCK